MKKLLVTALAIGLVLTLGVGFANAPSASHEVDIRIPNVLFLRITNGTTNARLDGTTINFNFTADADAINDYLDHISAITDPDDAWIGSTDGTPAFGDVIVFSNRNNAWRVTVEATAFAAAGFGLDRVRVTPSRPNLSTSTAAGTSWTLSTAAENIFTAGGRTQGWKSLGFSATDYEIRLDGTELSGDYLTTVTYTILQP